MKNLLVKMWRDDDGQDMIEYVLIAGLITLAAVVMVQTVGTDVNTVWTNVESYLSSVPS
jgi:pilus assembly protein Flp/PilA